jgi:hypothetical protein
VNKHPELAMYTVFSVATFLAVIAWMDGGLVIDVPGFGPPTVNRGVE